MPKLTPIQARVLAFCKEYIAKNDNFPPFRIIAKRFRYKSPNSAQQHIKALVKKGLVEASSPGRYRIVKDKGNTK